jgi:ribosomal protein L11 methyltransferase
MTIPQLWRVAVTVPAVAAEAAATAIGEEALAIATFEADPDGLCWLIEATWPYAPEPAEIATRLALVAEAAGIDEPAAVIEPLPAVDWVRKVYQGFPPIRAGRFFLYGSHHEGEVPAGTVGLQIDAATAFGTGEHGSTRGCLLALDRLARRRRRTGRPLGRPFDLGCGSGILALAIARVWGVRVGAADLDPDSVRTARENARINRLGPRLRIGQADGWRAGLSRTHPPCRLIVANILARPLARMAPGLARHLAPGGYAVLSGLLVRQERHVLQAHRGQGLVLAGRVTVGEWRTLILRRPG